MAIWAGGKVIEVKVRYRELDWWRLNRDRVERNLVPGHSSILGVGLWEKLQPRVEPH